MKIKLTLVLSFFMLLILAACNSCASNDKTTNETVVMFEKEKLSDIADTTIVYLNKESTVKNDLPVSYFPADKDTVKRAIFKKEIEPMKVDTAWKQRTDSSYRKLEKTEQNIIDQQRWADSIMIIKKR